MATLSVVVITRNEERNLGACLDSVGFADEIIVVDDQSTDATRQIAARYTDKVFSRPLDRFGRQKQFAIEQATGDWVLVLDADERVTEALAEEIRGLLECDAPAYDGYKLRRRSWLDGVPVEFSTWYKASHLRLFRRGCARYVDRRVHEYPLLLRPDKCGSLRAPLEHYTWQSAGQYRAKFERYARLAAQDWYDAGRRCRGLTLPWYLVAVPMASFLRELIVYRGILGGRVGWRIACMSAHAPGRSTPHPRGRPPPTAAAPCGSRRRPARAGPAVSVSPWRRNCSPGPTHPRGAPAGRRC